MFYDINMIILAVAAEKNYTASSEAAGGEWMKRHFDDSSDFWASSNEKSLHNLKASEGRKNIFRVYVKNMFFYDKTFRTKIIEKVRKCLKLIS